MVLYLRQCRGLVLRSSESVYPARSQRFDSAATSNAHRARSGGGKMAGLTKEGTQIRRNLLSGIALLPSPKIVP